MPIVKTKPDVAVDKRPLPAGDLLEEKKIFKTVTQDAAVNPPESLMLYMEGMPWTVTWYSQLLGEHDDLREIDIALDAALQQYRRIYDLEIRVQNELSQNYDDDTGRVDVTGSSVVVGLIPNVYDYFVTDAGTKGKGLFMVTSSTRKTYNNGSVYEVNYALVGYIESGTAKDRYSALEDRSVTTFHYHKERIQAGMTGLLTTSQHGTAKQLMRDYGTILNHFVQRYVSPHDRLIIVPEEDVYQYDPLLAEFLLSTADVDVCPYLAKVSRASFDRDPYLTLASIWTAMVRQDFDTLNYAFRKAAVVNRGYFTSNSFMLALNTWNIDVFTYPDVTANNMRASRTIKPDANYGYMGPYVGKNDALVQAVTGYAGKDIRLIYEANRGGYYVLSEHFYAQDDNQSLLEILVSNYLKKETINLNELALLVTAWSSWPEMEQFYYAPLLLVLIKSATGGFYG
jgi:hypothetical protein